jgi:hypothetical protein
MRLLIKFVNVLEKLSLELLRNATRQRKLVNERGYSVFVFSMILKENIGEKGTGCFHVLFFRCLWLRIFRMPQYVGELRTITRKWSI